MGKDGFPAGPWTPELLAEAISQIDSNRIGVDLRTVQLWFQENDKGISTVNIRWLARIFGCDDPVATGEWQLELGAAQTRLTAKRREWKRAGSSAAPGGPDVARTATLDDETAIPAEIAPDTDATGLRRHYSLAMKSEAILGRGSPLNLPAWVFAGISALGFLSYFLGIHDVTYARPDGVVKQVGFLWAANWTFIFMVFFPLFFWLVRELLVFWRGEGRLKFASLVDKAQSDHDWARGVEASSHSYWAVFLICVLFAGLFQWIGVCLLPLMNGGGDYAIDWGTIAIARPEIVSVPMEIIFTALAYLYMCLCFYLFFAGLILLHTLIHDLWKTGKEYEDGTGFSYHGEADEIRLRMMHGIFRCTLLGFLSAIIMKLQNAYLMSHGENIMIWLAGDMSSAFYGQAYRDVGISFRSPTHFSSFLILVSTGVVFLYGFIRLGAGSGFHVILWKMSVVVAFLAISYLLIDAFSGFSILLGVGVLLAIYGLIDPGFGRWRASELGNNQSVS